MGKQHLRALVSAVSASAVIPNAASEHACVAATDFAFGMAALHGAFLREAAGVDVVPL